MEAEIGIDFLVRCFGESWNGAMYQWYLQRVFHGEAPDRLVLIDGRRAVATAGIAYRQLRTPDGAIHRVGIMVAACTAPGERGRGRFSRLWRDAIDHCATRGRSALLAFVTADNATCHELRRVGAAAIPSSYIISDDPPPEPTAVAPSVADVAHSEWRDYADGALQLQCSTAVAGFHYPDVDAWRSQFVDRPHPVELVRVGDTSRAIIERVDDTDRLQWLDGDPQEQGAAIAAVVERARRVRRRFFMYSTAAAPASILQDCGLKVRPGFMMAMATQPEHEPVVRSWPTLPWRVQSGDRL
ncbi:MAG: GNAT family N-acetyltransferase [Gammaproteobacteria bacterium]